jgi:cytochrome b subunit of formate dehydrogenase
VSKVRAFLIIDLCILAAFVVSAVSGLTFYIPARWVDATSSTVPTFLGMEYKLWVDIHTYSGLVMIAGCITHIVLHWRWMMRVAGGMLPWSSRRKGQLSEGADDGVVAGGESWTP